MRSITPSTSYTMSAGGSRQLGRVVAGIERAPGKMIDPAEFAEIMEDLDVSGVLASLPGGLSEADFIGILKLTMLTECATETFADAIETNALRHDAGWLFRFTHNVWTPDELTHATPYKYILMRLGFAESELDREIRETRGRSLEHRSGVTPMHLTTYGMLSEYATDKWHGAIHQMLRRSCPAAAYMAARVKRRETFHRVWYRDMTAVQIQANPGLARYVGEVMLTFRMPGASLAPELQKEAGRWLTLMEWDFEPAAKELIRLLNDVLAEPGRLGRLLMTIAAERGERIGPLSGRSAQRAMALAGGAGYGLVGEALLESAGLGYLVDVHDGGEGSGVPANEPLKLRRLLRTWLARRLDLDMRSRFTNRATT
ncbi:MAG: acyl-ACP desaturase [Chloroflexi bacterium]|nr:acyl-ACP desaturase [Chloroflexota bacterium]